MAVNKEENNEAPKEEIVNSTIDPKGFEDKQIYTIEKKIEAKNKLEDDKKDDIEIS